MQNDLLDMNCMELRSHISAGQIKSTEAAEATFRAMDKYEPLIGAYLSTFEEQAHARAGEMVGARLGNAGMIASDLLPVLPLTIKQLKETV